MPLVQLTLESINDLDDGRVAVAFMQELRRAVTDCMDRPGDTTARSVSLETALSKSVASIRDRIVDELPGVPVLYGTP